MVTTTKWVSGFEAKTQLTYYLFSLGLNLPLSKCKQIITDLIYLVPLPQHFDMTPISYDMKSVRNSSKCLAIFFNGLWNYSKTKWLLPTNNYILYSFIQLTMVQTYSCFFRISILVYIMLKLSYLVIDIK